MRGLRTTRELVRRFRTRPGSEGVDVEFKAKEVTQTNDGRRELVKRLSAIANSGGGTVIVGVRREGSGIHLQGFEVTDETKRDLFHVIRDSTKPSLDRSCTIEFDKYEGVWLLRIDLRAAEGPILFHTTGKEGWVAYRRVGDTTRAMSHDELLEWKGRGRLRDDPFLGPVLDIDLSAVKGVRKRPRVSVQRRRLITTATDLDQVLLVPYLDLATHSPRGYRMLEAHPTLASVDKVRALLVAATKHLKVPTDDNFTYTIQQGSRRWFGATVENFLEDLRNITATVDAMVGGDPRTLPVKEAGLREYRPLILAGAAIGQDVFWLQMDYRQGAEAFFHESCGLLMGEALFDDAGARAFFHEIKFTPWHYRTIHGPQRVFLRTQYRLKNAILVTMVEGDVALDYVEADNPFYLQDEFLKKSIPEGLPSFLARALCSMSRLLFLVTGGGARPQDKHFDLREIELIGFPTMTDSVLLDAHCWAERGRRERRAFEDQLDRLHDLPAALKELERDGKVKRMGPVQSEGT